LQTWRTTSFRKIISFWACLFAHGKIRFQFKCRQTNQAIRSNAAWQIWRGCNKSGELPLVASGFGSHCRLPNPHNRFCPSRKGIKGSQRVLIPNPNPRKWHVGVHSIWPFFSSHHQKKLRAT